MESYYSRNKDKWKAYYESHKAEISIRNKIQRETNRPARLLDLRRRSQEIKAKVLTFYSNSNRPMCVWCGEDRLPCLSIDHIEGGGTQHRKKIGGGSNLYRWLINEKYPEGYQTLCMNCQMIKKDTDNECHRDEKFSEEE